nr:MAG TPA: hypothetical protein [Caudoviricetes sp.]
MKLKLNKGLKKSLFLCLLKGLVALMLIVLTGLLFSNWGRVASNDIIYSLVGVWAVDGILLSLLDCLE